MEIIEKFICGKKDMESCEDYIFASENFIAILDGATTKEGFLYNGVTGGKYICNIIERVLLGINPKIDSIGLLEELANAVNQEEKKFNIHNEKMSASIIVFSIQNNYVVSYGDCIFKINNEEYYNLKHSDIEFADKRAQINKELLKNGMTVNELQHNDIGRQGIINDLLNVQQKANNLNDGYPVINGDSIIPDYAIIKHVKKGDKIIFATDGYLKIFDSLKESEEFIHDIINKDPLLINEYKQTKGVATNNNSFDDRAYIRFIV